MPGFDEVVYVTHADFEERDLESHLDEYETVRAATVVMLGHLSPAAWLRRGEVNDYEATVRGLVFHMAGHELHHLRVIRERYLGLLG